MPPSADDRRTRVLRSWPLGAAGLIAFVTWPVASLTPTYGVDPSWRIALHMAVARGIDFGDLAFTYGPLGFLNVPLNAEAHTLVPALLWVALLQVTLAYLIIECGRRTLTWPGAVILALITCRLLDEGREVLPLVAFLWAALVVQWGVPPRVGRILLPVSGVVSGLGILVKVNEGVVALACAGVAAWWLGPRRWRALGVLAASALAAIVVVWIAMGNAALGLFDWTIATARVAAGYSAGLPYDDPTRSWEYPLFILVVAAVVWSAWQGWDGVDRGRRIALGLLGAFFVFTLFKHGFVRHDLGHTPSTFTALMVLPAAIRWGTSHAARVSAAGACLAVVAGAFVSWGVTGIDAAGRFLDVSPRVEAAGDALALSTSPGERRDRREEAKRALRDHHFVPLPVIETLRGRAVHVEPSETSIVWAYDLRWRPPPAFQDYVIVSNALDRANADALTSPDGPDRILRHAGPRVDSHSPEGEGPEQLQAMICGFEPIAEASFPGWQVLRRAAGRCGPERPISSVTADAGDEIPIPGAPSTDDMVVARVDIRVPLLQRLRTALFKPRELPLIYYGPELRYEVPASVAAGPLLMRVPQTVGWAEYADPLPYETITVLQTASPVTIEFAAVRVRGSTGPE